MADQFQDFNCSIPDFFSEKTVALTGATGYIGQLLVEKLLRSCPCVKKLYLLIRSSETKSCQNRLHHISSLPIFDKLRNSQPDFTAKLVALPCDLAEENLGLSEDSYSIISSEVNVFFHCAATVKFDDHLRKSFNVNTLGVRRLLKLCRNIRKLQAFVHVSTAYSYCDHKTIEEQIYPTGWDYDKLHSTMQCMSDETISEHTPKILGDRPNTYTLTKAFGEEVVSKEGVGLPICIVRPSIIGASYKEPIPGWCANVNGPTGLFIAYGKGFLRVLCNKKSNCMDVIPSDFVVNGIIAAAWKTARTFSDIEFLSIPQSPVSDSKLRAQAISSSITSLQKMGFVELEETKEVRDRRKTVPIYHLVANTGRTLTISSIGNMVRKTYEEFPLDNVIRVPHFIEISNRSFYHVLSFLLEDCPAIILDFGRTLTGKKRKVSRLVRQVKDTQDMLRYFFNDLWVWKNRNSINLENELSSEDRKEFYFNAQEVNWKEYFKNYCQGAKKHILKEDPKNYPLARRHIRRLRAFGLFCQLGFIYALWRYVLSRRSPVPTLRYFFLSFCLKLFRILQFLIVMAQNTYSKFFSF